MAADQICSPIADFPDERKVWVAEDVVFAATLVESGKYLADERRSIIKGLGWLDFSWKPTQRKTCFLGVLVTDEFQGHGVGTQLMTTMIAEAQSGGMRKIALRVYSTNQPAIRLYKKFGFELEGYFVANERDADDGPMDVMSWGRLL